ncbi:asparagine synthase-related protein [Vibrio neonatus]|uniref:asparagine synthase-related protein n=1 Tax=Vibrio neonatus TaxID=278860 RepID=UPI0021C35E54|nr:asparagine synthase-related protein [Vibrio neonatus]
MFEYYDCLGSRSYYHKAGSFEAHKSIRDVLNGNISSINQVDETAILSILMKNYAIGDRTLIQGIERTPWMSRLSDDGSCWVKSELPVHGHNRVDPSKAANTLHEKLKEEVLQFICDKHNVGILLSGGMDSRIVAGIVKLLQESGEYSGKVTALTWGIPESRDVVYAERIATEFNWDFRYFELNSEVLSLNIKLAALRGAEYSPVHLHAMELVSQTKGIDGILAGSYGDSIGRGEYSGRRTDRLPSILEKHLHHFSFLLKDVESIALSNIQCDLNESRARFPALSEMAYREIEMQMHYMRRQLNSCMEVIDDEIPLYQMFTAPKSFGYMWSLASECRTDDVYEHLLNKLPHILQSIPWARTGKKYNQKSALIEDNNLPLNNRYGLWLRTELRSQVIDSISSGALQSLGIFNNSSLKMWIRYWSKNSYAKADRLDEKMAWLASLAQFVDIYDIKQSQTDLPSRTFKDSMSQAKAYIHTRLYHEALKRKM